MPCKICKQNFLIYTFVLWDNLLNLWIKINSCNIDSKCDQLQPLYSAGPKAVQYVTMWNLYVQCVWTQKKKNTRMTLLFIFTLTIIQFFQLCLIFLNMVANLSDFTSHGKKRRKKTKQTGKAGIVWLLVRVCCGTNKRSKYRKLKRPVPPDMDECYRRLWMLYVWMCSLLYVWMNWPPTFNKKSRHSRT